MKQIGFRTFSKLCNCRKMNYTMQGHYNCSHFWYGEPNLSRVKGMFGGTHLAMDYFCKEKHCPVFKKLKNAK